MGTTKSNFVKVTVRKKNRKPGLDLEVSGAGGAPQRAGALDEVAVEVDVAFDLDVGPELGEEHLHHVDLAVAGGDYERRAALALLLHHLSTTNLVQFGKHKNKAARKSPNQRMNSYFLRHCPTRSSLNWLPKLWIC